MSTTDQIIVGNFTNIEYAKTENTELIKPITNGFVTPVTDYRRTLS